MTQKGKKNVEKITIDKAGMKNVLMEQKDFLVPVVQEAVQTILEVEMEECLQAGKHERSAERQGLSQRVLPAALDNASGDDGIAGAARPWRAF